MRRAAGHSVRPGGTGEASISAGALYEIVGKLLSSRFVSFFRLATMFLVAYCIYLILVSYYSFLLLLVRHLFLEAMHLSLVDLRCSENMC